MLFLQEHCLQAQFAENHEKIQNSQHTFFANAIFSIMNKWHIEFAKIGHVNFLSKTWNIKKDNIQLCFARDFLRNRIRRKRCETTKPIVNNICKTEHINEITNISNFTTETRTQVARVKAEYPNQLDHGQ